MKSFGKKKQCSHCRKIKTVTKFYKNRTTVDGLEYGCKECSGRMNKLWRIANRPIVRKIKSKWNKANKKKVSNYHKNWRKRNRKLNNYHHLARKKLHYAIKLGKIKRKPCSVCGNPKSHGHHKNYDKPLEVIWLCAIHHQLVHTGKLDII